MSYGGKRLYIAMVETAVFLVPVVVIYFTYFQIFLAKNTAGDRKHALIGFLLVFVIAALVWTYSLRTKVTSIRSSHELIIQNVWRSYRIPCSAIEGMSVGSFAFIRKIGPKLRVVEITYTLDRGSIKKTVPVLASFSAGKNSSLLDEFESIGSEYSIPRDLSKMIF
ncbi:MAG: hypothetical protein ACYDB2_07500 [Acidimicrobiales bacterium]